MGEKSIKKSCTDYWLDKKSMSLVGDFDGMYRDIGDPWGCSEKVNSLNNNLFLDLMFDKGCYGSILDVGCGMGCFTDRIYRRNSRENVFGGDISEVAVDKARKKYPHIEFHVINALSDMIRNKYHLITLNEVLWYVLDDLHGTFRRLHGALLDEGALAIKLYFPDRQRFGNHMLAGMSSFEDFIVDSELFVPDTVITSRASGGDGTVLLGLYIKL